MTIDFEWPTAPYICPVCGKLTCKLVSCLKCTYKNTPKCDLSVDCSCEQKEIISLLCSRIININNQEINNLQIQLYYLQKRNKTARYLIKQLLTGISPVSMLAQACQRWLDQGSKT